jgi:hypothetical protein
MLRPYAQKMAETAHLLSDFEQQKSRRHSFTIPLFTPITSLVGAETPLWVGGGKKGEK